MKTATQRIQPVHFEMGRVDITPRAWEKLTDGDIVCALHRHAAGDWGILCQRDWDENETALVEGRRLFSEYSSEFGEKFWIITEADRSVTTVMLTVEF